MTAKGVRVNAMYIAVRHAVCKAVCDVSIAFMGVSPTMSVHTRAPPHLHVAPCDAHYWKVEPCDIRFAR